MKTTFAFTSLAALFPSILLADFSGGDPMTSKSSKWDNFSNEGGAKAVFQNSRLEYLVQSPTSEDRSIMRWTPNEGAYDQDWFIQVDVHLDKVALNNNCHVNLNLGVVNSDDHNQGFFVALDRYRDGTLYVSGFEAGPANADELDHSDSASVDGTLRVHFDSDNEALTASWNSGAGWKYFAPEDISGWGMTNADTFTGILAAAGGGNDSGIGTGPVVKSGEACFANFKAGTAKPDIAIEQPAGSDLADGKAKRNFGTASIGGTVSKTFTIRNTGTAKLRGLAIRKNGTNAADFTVTGPSKSVLRPGGSCTFKVTFSPKTAGTKNAAIHIYSTDPDESPFDLKLAGEGVK